MAIKPAKNRPVLPILPYGRQSIDGADIEAVVQVLRGDWLTQGPKVQEFEQAFAARVGARHAVAVNSGTAALHAAMHGLGIGPGDEVILPPITFAATANCVVFQGGTPVFADVDSESGLLDPVAVAARITSRTKAIIAVDYAGLPCDYALLHKLADAHGLVLVADACHSLGAAYRGISVGSLATLNCFSFHPVKHIATGEGGMIATDDDTLADRMRVFRTHGITKDGQFRGLGSGVGASNAEPRTTSAEIDSALAERGPWYYEMQSLGFNYRMSDVGSALGVSQLKKLDVFVSRRREIAAGYYRGLAGIPGLHLPKSDLAQTPPDVQSVTHSFHLFPVRIDFPAIGQTRTEVMAELRARGVGTQVHYIPVNLQPFYRDLLGGQPGDCPYAEAFYAQQLSIPMYPAMTEPDVARVVAALQTVLRPGVGVR